MKNRSHSARAAAALALLFSLVWAANAQPTEYTVAAVTDAGVELAADFAVKEQSERTKKGITLGKILNAEDGQAKLGARHLRLCIEVKENGKASSAQVVVTMDQYSNLKLVRWTAWNCSSAADSGFKPVELPDVGVDMAADFAVGNQGAKTKKTIVLKEIVTAEDQMPVLGARNFRICMTTVVKRKPGSATVVVTMDQYSNLKLVSWTDGACGGSGVAFKPVDVNDAGVGLAADFAVKERAEKTKSTIVLTGVVKAEDGEAKLGARNLRLCLKTKVNGKSATVQVVVTVDQYSNHKLVSWAESGCGGK